MKVIDLRSDTLTKPDRTMRQVMADAEVGDDVYGEDPTVNKLQEMAVNITGKQTALYVPSGSMANHIAIKAHTEPGDEVLIGKNAHCYLYESGAGPVIAGVQYTQVGQTGIFDVKDFEQSIKEDNHHYTPTKLICCENTHNRGGGRIFPLDNIKRIREFAGQKRLKMHLDGARVFNASVQTGISVKEYASYFDTISFCLSKGLGAPVGSLICGPKDLIEGKIHRNRKMFGGAMRQAGILAAAGIYALENNIERLMQDHENAKLIAESVNGNRVFEIDLSTVETNILIFSIADKYKSKISAAEICEKFLKDGIVFSPVSNYSMRIVTHLDVSREDCQKVASSLSSYSV